MQLFQYPRPDTVIPTRSLRAIGFLLVRLIGLSGFVCLGCIALPRPGSADDALQPIHLRVGGREVATKETALAIGAEIYVPMDILTAVAAKGRLNARADAILVTTATENRPTELAVARPAGRRMLALSDLVRLLHADVVRSEMKDDDGKPIPGSKGDTVYLLARITDVHYADGSLHISTSFPVPFHAHMVDVAGAARGYVDCAGSAVAAIFQPTALPATDTNRERQAVRISAAQYTIDSARITVNLPRTMLLKEADGTTANEGASVSLVTRRTVPVVAESQSDQAGRPGVVDTSLVGKETGGGRTSPKPRPGEGTSIQRGTAPTGDAEGAPASAAVKDDEPDTDGPGQPTVNAHESSPTSLADRGGLPSRSSQFVRAGGAIEVRGIDFLPDDDNRVHIDISTSGRPRNSVHYLENGNLAIDIPNAVLNLVDSDRGQQTFAHPLLTGLQAEMVQDAPPLTRITLDTSHVVGFTVNVSNDKLSVDIRLPRNSGGVLADKVIVVDAGHGGTSSGATFGGVQEKNITLAIALKLRACLEACGARVVMTRDRDTTVPLYDRPNLANAINADLFISVHNDDTERANSASGTSSYYHKGDASSRALAVCVQQSVMAVTGLPSRGALSDGILYASGLAVLRCSSMPSVLVEVAYINNQRDRRKLVDDGFQQRVAQAMCDGLRHYVEGSPDTVRHKPSSAGANGEFRPKVQYLANLEH